MISLSALITDLLWVRNALQTWLTQNPGRSPARARVTIAMDAIDTARSTLNEAVDHIATEEPTENEELTLHQFTVIIKGLVHTSSIPTDASMTRIYRKVYDAGFHEGARQTDNATLDSFRSLNINISPTNVEQSLKGLK